MDQITQTIESYRMNFAKYTERSPKEVSGEYLLWIDFFISLLPKEAHLLELGSATGRDAKYLRDKGIDVLCTDVVPTALKSLSKQGFKTEYYDFRYKGKNGWSFDGIFGNAVLVHAHKDRLASILMNLHRMIKSSTGLIALSFKNGSGEEISSEKLDAPRYYQYYSEEDIEKYMAKAYFDIIYLAYAEKRKWILCIAKTKL